MTKARLEKSCVAIGLKNPTQRTCRRIPSSSETFDTEPDESGFGIEFEHKRKVLYIYGLLQPTRPETGLGGGQHKFSFSKLTYCTI